MKLFVPGRICLFGEHSDWAGGYRRENPDLEKGCCIIAGTNQGLYADIEPHPSSLVITSILHDGTAQGPFSVDMDSDALFQCAKNGGFFSYAAGAALEILKRFQIKGLRINNYHTDLPVRKGLSSSAALSVLVARAFNGIYDLKLSISDEMELAYLGEIATGSQCGRMDQGCAHGNKTMIMTFDGDQMDVEEILIGKDLYLVIVDLAAGKDTREILNCLNRSYPIAHDEISRNVQKYLGSISFYLTNLAARAFRDGNAEAVGKLMTEAQNLFDTHVAPACPSELTAPVLHRVLQHGPIQDLVLGGKGVGSQGDGTAQFIVRNEEAQRQVIEIIQRDLGMSCLDLTLRSRTKVRKAVIPAAGFGTRLFPATKVVKKEFFPVVDRHGRIKPVIQVIVEEAIESGIEEICIIVQEEDKSLFQDFFHNPPEKEFYDKLSVENQNESDSLLNIGKSVHLVSQTVQEGFGHAVHCAAEFVGDEPFLLMLGDHLFASNNGDLCVRQALDIFEATGKSVVGLQVTSGDKVSNFGCVTGRWRDRNGMLTITEFAEKPDISYARKNLHVQGLDDDSYLTLFGMYVLKPRVFRYLNENIKRNNREYGEFQLTSCLDRLRREDGFDGFVVDGQRFDIGLPESYRDTMIRFRVVKDK
ncbi:GHMP kinase [bacterium]|nr:GHMP kinase [bacterium]